LCVLWLFGFYIIKEEIADSTCPIICQTMFYIVHKYRYYIKYIKKELKKRISSCQIFYQTMFLRDGYQILRKKCFSSYALRLSLVTRLWCSVVKNTDTRTLANLVYGYGPYRVRIGIRIFLVHIRSSVSRIRSVMFIVNF